MNHYLALTIGVLLAGAGGELFVRGTVGLARWARVSAGIIGATVAAFATSSPELSVAVNAALTGVPAVSFGDVLGSNIINIALILGLVLTIGQLRTTRQDVQREYPSALLAPVVIGILAVDGFLSRTDGIILLGLFVAWLVAVTLEVRRQRGVAGEILGEARLWLAALLSLIGLGLLIAAGRLIVFGATGIGEFFGLSAFIIGAVIVAVGTSVPELATAVISKMRGHEEVGLGTVYGSNIFNSLLILGIVAVISPFKLVWGEVTSALFFGIVTVAITFPTRDGIIQRWRGAVLLGLYAAYLVSTILQARG
ncbi:MAG: calcium/sodium antiporter [Armatimonadota bacterium]